MKMNKEVETFLNDIQLVSDDFYHINLATRELFLTSSTELAEMIKYGGIVYFNQDELIGGIFTYKKHISIEFSNGAEFNDLENLLEGKGKFRRHVKLTCLDDISNKKLSTFISQALKAS